MGSCSFEDVSSVCIVKNDVSLAEAIKQVGRVGSLCDGIVITVRYTKD